MQPTSSSPSSTPAPIAGAAAAEPMGDVPVFYYVQPRAKSRASSGSATTIASLASSLASTSASSSVASSSPLKRTAAADERSRLRRLVSLSYYSGKVKHWFHREDRDTLVSEEEDEDAFRRANDELEFAAEATGSSRSRRCSSNMMLSVTAGVAGAFYASWMDSKQPAAATARTAEASGPSEYEPSKDQRWCTNCTKCFHRKLSRFDQFCGLDCKTAHRFRLAAA
ncbi:hypothetical protein PybrP1_004127 [[Pythium] brassicae (nom. inval.)]|nr:hypothetical protein PybrP1_004127 [[Pythium] brassicae (nom. inval.)]